MIAGVELRQLRYLVTIADEGNLGRAAATLYVSQPALSYALKNLESELGVRLFDRHAGGGSATPAGADLAAGAPPALPPAHPVAARRHRHPRRAAGAPPGRFPAERRRR